MSFENFETFNYDAKGGQKKIHLGSIKGINRDILLNLYSQMVQLRRCEEALIKEYHPADEMRCPVHFCVGQEGVPAALSLLIKKEDHLYSHHRSHGYYFAKGAPLNALFAELYGKETGANGGKAGSQDISMASHNFHSGAILAGSIAIAAGTAFALKLKKSSSCAVTGFGDAATDEGVFWETINYAALKKLPLLFICENNNYGTFSPQRKRSATCNISERVTSFGIKTTTVYGNDVAQVYQKLDDAFKYIRSGQGPAFVEAFTYRWNGHVGPENDDVFNYRPAEELKFWKEHCPIALLERLLIEEKIFKIEDKENIFKKADLLVSEAFEFARNSPFPNLSRSELEGCNFSNISPAADRLLKNDKNLHFNEEQAELIPGPY